MTGRLGVAGILSSSSLYEGVSVPYVMARGSDAFSLGDMGDVTPLALDLDRGALTELAGVKIVRIDLASSLSKEDEDADSSTTHLRSTEVLAMPIVLHDAPVMAVYTL